MRRGAIADDFTGATDLAGNWRARGLRTAVYLGVPGVEALDEASHYDAIVVALKTRSVDRAEAVRQARTAAQFLRSVGCEQVYDKYCSTFDSTAEGNIGPVADALLEFTGAAQAVVVPAFPDNARTVYQGHLFVGDEPLHESPMKDHPLNPMRDSSLPRLLQAQSTSPVGLISLEVVRQGATALQGELARQEDLGRKLVVVDAIANSDLAVIAEATSEAPLVTGGSGLALGLRKREGTPEAIRTVSGRKAILSGSASAATRAQVAHAQARIPHLKLDLKRIVVDADAEVNRVVAWAESQWASGPDRPVLIYSVGDGQDVEEGRRVAESASMIVEAAFSRLAVSLANAGVTQYIVAGGETSASVLAGLVVQQVVVGEMLSPGVSWLVGVSRDGQEFNFVLKSGNFGTEDLFDAAWDALT